MKKKTKQQRLHWPLIEKDDSFVIDAPFSSSFLSLSQHHEVEQTKQKKRKQLTKITKKKWTLREKGVGEVARAGVCSPVSECVCVCVSVCVLVCGCVCVCGCSRELY